MENLNLSEKQKEMIDIFVKALPFLRKELNISQTELGKKVGKSRQTISSIERGVSPLEWDTFLSIVLFFKVNWNKHKDELSELEKFLMVDTNDNK